MKNRNHDRRLIILRRKTGAVRGRAAALPAALFIALVLLLLPASAAAPSLDKLPLSKAEAVYIYNTDNDRVLTQKNAEKRIHPASTVKIMSGLICCEFFSGRLDERITVTDKMLSAVDGRHMGLKAGDRPTVRDLLYLGFCGCFNDAIAVMEFTLSGSDASFVALMNARAAEIGMTDTFYTNATGVHNDNMYTTARDTALLAVEAMKSGLYMTVTSAVSYTTEGIAKPFSFDNYNRLIASGGYCNSLCRGMNAGNTPNAGYAAVTAAEKNGLTVVSVVMGAQTDDYNNIYSYILTTGLLEWAFASFGNVDVFGTSSVICEVPVDLALDTKTVIAVPERSVSYFLPLSVKISPRAENDADQGGSRGEKENADTEGYDITYRYRLTCDRLDAPVPAGTRVGFLTVYYLGAQIDSVPLVTKSPVSKSELLYVFDRVREFTRSDFFIGMLITAAAATVIYIVVSAVIRGSRPGNGKKRPRRNTSRKNGSDRLGGGTPGRR